MCRQAAWVVLWLQAGNAGAVRRVVLVLADSQLAVRSGEYAVGYCDCEFADQLRVVGKDEGAGAGR